jgi:hypothetical protein
LIVFYADGSMSFHEGVETLDEYRYEPRQLHSWPRLTQSTSDALLLVDTHVRHIEPADDDEQHGARLFRWFRSARDAHESVNERLVLLEHSDPDRLIETLMGTGDYGEALRVCQVFQRSELSDQIHEEQVRSSSSQLPTHLTKIRSRLRVLQLTTTLVYPTFDEQLDLIQFGLEQATRQRYFLHLALCEQDFGTSIADEHVPATPLVSQRRPLTVPQTHVLFYRRRLLEQRAKLRLLGQLTEREPVVGAYGPHVFAKFREWDYPEIARRCARVRSTGRSTRARTNERTPAVFF